MSSLFVVSLRSLCCLTGRIIIFSFLALLGFAKPFPITSMADLQTDGRLSWAGFSNVDGALVPDNTSIDVLGVTGAKITVVGAAPAAMSIVSLGIDTFLAHSGTGAVTLRSTPSWQGVGLQLTHTAEGRASYRMDVFGVGGALLGSARTASPLGMGETAFLGVVNPAGGIVEIRLQSESGTDFLLRDLLLQLRPTPETSFASLPVTSVVTLPLSPVHTYLHEGVSPAIRVSRTEQATLDNYNAYDLRALFPSLLSGDRLRFERVGYARDGEKLNAVLGVFTHTAVIEANHQPRRLPAALDAGRDFATPTVTGGLFTTATNIPEDFLIGSSTMVSVPEKARYLMFSLERPSEQARMLSIRVSHLRKDDFLDWRAAYGLHGARADPADDLDSDGLTLLEEFAFGKDPTTADAMDGPSFAFPPRLVSKSQADGRWMLAFGARHGAPLRYSAEFSSDLMAWEIVPAAVLSPHHVDAMNGQAMYHVLDAFSGPRRFGRVRIEYVRASP